jgi:hypothetical protein
MLKWTSWYFVVQIRVADSVDLGVGSERVELIEGRLYQGVRKPEGAAAGHYLGCGIVADVPQGSTGEGVGNRRPAQVLLVVPHRGAHRRRPVVIHHDQAARPDDLAQEVELYEYLVET